MRVAIIHPWFPQYRARFFEDLLIQGEARGFTINIFHGDPPPEWATRGDSVSSSIATRMTSRFFRVGSRSLVYKSLEPLLNERPYDLIIVEQGVRNLETYRLLLSKHRMPLAFWGHGRTYTKSVGKTQEWLKFFLTKQGKWFFAYTPGGVEAVVAEGYPRRQTCVLQNTIDASGLADSISLVSESDKEDFRKKYDLRSQSAIFIGGLDSSKRLPFLVEAASRVHKLNNDFRLVVAGNGEERKFVEAAAEVNPWIKYIGPVFDHAKAVAMSTSEVLAMPGRVGLVAVDSFAARLPIVTTEWPWHAPEFEYLENGSNALVTADTIGDYASALHNLLTSPGQLQRLRSGCASSSQKYELGAMVNNFLGGLESYREMVSLKRPGAA